MIAIDERARPATDADINVVAELAALGAAELITRRGGAMWARREARQAPLEEGLRHDLHDDDALVIVGTIDEVVVGYSAIRLELLHDGTTVGRIGDLFVIPEARGVGVGEAMMELLLDWARQRGCLGVDSLALPGERHTKNFFETHGLVARSIIVHRQLDTPAAP